MVKNTALLRKRSIREGRGSRIFDVLNIGFLILFTLSILYPFLYMFSVSISDPELVAMNKVVLWPMGKLTVEAYIDVVQSSTLLSSYRNSIVYAFTGTLLSVSVACLGGYALTKKFKLRTFCTLMLLATMFIQPGLIPNYINIKNLRLLNTMWAFVLPASLSMWFIILARTNFLQIPASLFETAYLDGANDWYVL
ncbi:MAG: carbohydrate ABC transporter permease, partial [Spirochaetales bacterium]|nr:carbohydrate ABC transporter permease [Spirochaetales bacterium]